MSGKINQSVYFIISAIILLQANPAQGRTIMVGYGAGYDFNTIQSAINDSNDCDIVLVADGTYTG